jgi:hypothetical protein
MKLPPSPSPETDPSERILSDDEAVNLACIPEARRRAEQSNVKGVILGSEKITQHPYFGYIFRYETTELRELPKVERTKDGLKEVGKSGEFREYCGVLTLWTRDGERFNLSFMSKHVFGHGMTLYEF